MMTSAHVHKAKVTLTAPQSLTMAEQWSEIWAGISSQLPLRNLHWKPASRTSIRTIQTLQVDLHALETVKDEGASQIPASLLEKPLLNVYVVTCDETESYKSSVRKQVKEWHTQVSQRKNQEWVIINVSRTDTRQSQSGLLKMRGTVLDRLKADFNVDKKDRCAQVTWGKDYKSPAIWAEAMSKIKDGIIMAFDQAVTMREEEVKRTEQQRTMPGWNFCTFFLIKESLASSFEGAGLYEDALMQYEELEASFFQVLKDKTLWFGKFIEAAPKDDSSPLLSLSKKPYRDLIIGNAISVFDIRIYLLARQSLVLGQMKRVCDVARKVVLFLGAFGGRLQEIKDELPVFFTESWIYSSALGVVETCDEWAKDIVPEISANVFSAVKGELLSLARQQLDSIGVRLGYLPNEPPFSSVSNSDEESCKPSTAEKKRISQSVSSQDILSSINSQASFYDSYTKLTNRAIELFVKAGRRKFALKMHGSLAALDLYRERHSNAQQTYASLPAHYAPHRWSGLESYMLFRDIETQNCMQKDHDRQWIHTALAFIKSYVDENGLVLSGIQSKDQYISRLMEAVVEASTKVEGDLVFQDSPILNIRPVAESARCAGGRDGFHFDVMVKNMLSGDIPIDKVTLLFAGRRTEMLEFSSESFTAKPGSQTITMYCPTPLSGGFLVDKAEAYVGRILFSWQLRGKQQERAQSTSSLKGYNTLVKFPADPSSTRLNIRQASNVEIGGRSSIQIDLQSGRNALRNTVLSIASPESTFDIASGKLSSMDQAAIEFGKESISLTGAEAGNVFYFEIPQSVPATTKQTDVRVTLEYETEHEPGLRRKLVSMKTIDLSRDISVNVQDYFRDKKLITKFIVSTMSHQHARISSVNLETSQADKENLAIVSPGHFPGILTVTPAQSATFIYQLEPRGEVSDPLKLTISYALLREEVESIVVQCINSTLADLSQTVRDAVLERVIDILESFPTWIDYYEVTGQIRLPTSDFEITGLNAEDRRKLLETFEKSEDVERSRRKRFTIPVDLPRLDIFASAKIELVANPFDLKPLAIEDMPPVFAGQPVTAILTIHCSSFWAANERRAQQYRMRFQVDENIKDWLISGQKRGEFKAKDDTTFSVTITLMAVRHGELPLPSVQVSAYSLDGSSAAPPTLETYQVHAAERLLVLPRGGRTTYFLNVGGEPSQE